MSILFEQNEAQFNDAQFLEYAKKSCNGISSAQQIVIDRNFIKTLPEQSVNAIYIDKGDFIQYFTAKLTNPADTRNFIAYIYNKKTKQIQTTSWYCNNLARNQNQSEIIEAMRNAGFLTYDVVQKNVGRQISKEELDKFYDKKQVGNLVFYKQRQTPNAFQYSSDPTVASKQKEYINNVIVNSQTTLNLVGSFKDSVTPDEMNRYKLVRIPNAPANLFPDGLYLWYSQSQSNDDMRQQIKANKPQEVDLRTCKQAIESYYTYYRQRETMTNLNPNMIVQLKNVVQSCKNKFHPNNWGPLSQHLKQKIDELTNNVPNYDEVARQFKLK